MKSIMLCFCFLCLLSCSNSSATGPENSTYVVSGTVTANGVVLPGVIIHLTGDATSTTTTDIGGNFSVTDVQNGSYTLTPLKAAYTFIPDHISVTINNANYSNLNFTATTDVTTILVPKTGQTVSYTAGDDGALQKGLAWPNPRFTDSGNGTITDNLTGLLWLKNANCFGVQVWETALASANALTSGSCGLSDGSTAGKWRLPNITELESLVDLSVGTLPSGHPFSGVQTPYWSSSTVMNITGSAWYLDMKSGSVSYDGNITYNGKGKSHYLWPVSGESILLPATGQNGCYDGNGSPISCTGTGQDGERQKGVAWPSPRFINNDNGTISDRLTKLVWLKDANCFGIQFWPGAFYYIESLASGICGLSDGSIAGQWRLPNRKELQSLIDRSRSYPPLPSGHPFSGVQSNYYWSSSSRGGIWTVSMFDGIVGSFGNNKSYFSVWPVRDGLP